MACPESLIAALAGPEALRLVLGAGVPADVAVLGVCALDVSLRPVRAAFLALPAYWSE